MKLTRARVEQIVLASQGAMNDVDDVKAWIRDAFRQCLSRYDTYRMVLEEAEVARHERLVSMLPYADNPERYTNGALPVIQYKEYCADNQVLSVLYFHCGGLLKSLLEIEWEAILPELAEPEWSQRRAERTKTSGHLSPIALLSCLFSMWSDSRKDTTRKSRKQYELKFGNAVDALRRELAAYKPENTELQPEKPAYFSRLLRVLLECLLREAAMLFGFYAGFADLSLQIVFPGLQHTERARRSYMDA